MVSARTWFTIWKCWRTSIFLANEQTLASALWTILSQLILTECSLRIYVFIQCCLPSVCHSSRFRGFHGFCFVSSWLDALVFFHFLVTGHIWSLLSLSLCGLFHTAFFSPKCRPSIWHLGSSILMVTQDKIMFLLQITYAKVKEEGRV